MAAHEQRGSAAGEHGRTAYPPSLWRALAMVPRSFATYLCASLVDGLGTGVARLALPWLIFDVTHSAFVLGLVASAQLASVWISPLLGVVVDRVDRRRILLLSAVCRAGAWAAIAYVAGGSATSSPSVVAVIVALAFVQQGFGALTTQARAVVRAVLTPVAARVAINTAWFTVVNVTWYLSPALGGVLIGRSGAVAALWVTALSSGVMIVPTLLLPAVPPGVRRQQRPSVIADMAGGWSALRGEPILLWLTGYASVYNGVWQAVMAISVALYRADLHLGAVQVGVLMLVAGAVTTSTGTLIPWLRRHVTARGVLTWSLLLEAVGAATLGAAGEWPVAAAGIALTDTPSTAYLVLTSLVAQERIPREIYGRVNAIRSTLSSGANALWALGAGTLSAALGVRGSIDCMAAVALAAAVVFPRTPLASLKWPAADTE